MMEKNCKIEKKGSLTKELVFIIVALVAGTILLCYVLNATLIERYYITNKQNTLLEGFEVIDEASASGELNTPAFDVAFDNLCANGNINILIINSNQTIVRSSANDARMMLMEFMNILFNANTPNSAVLEQQNNYNILRQRDVRLNSEYLVLYGSLQNGNLILMRSALASIRESADISNRFLAIVGSIAVVISTIITFFVSKGITNPIRELSAISEKMTKLDFNVIIPQKKRKVNCFLRKNLQSILNLLPKTENEQII